MKLFSAFVFLAVCISSYSQEVYWSFDQKPSEGPDEYAGAVRWVDGLKGNAILFDGFTTCITRSKHASIDATKGLTVEAGIALASYPWNWVPIITQGPTRSNSFSFSVGPRGQLGLEIWINGESFRSVSEDFLLPVYEWSFVAATYSPGEGTRLFLNGQEVRFTSFNQRLRRVEEGELRIGMNYEAVKPSNQIGPTGNLPYWFAIDGLLDEITLISEAIGAEAIAKNFTSLGAFPNPALERRRLPSGPENMPDRFGAVYTRLKYYNEWDALWPVDADPDVVVTFENSPVRLVFWRGTRYSPAWVSETGLWMADQSVEAWNGEEGCFEHMQDPKCKYSHVRIIENSPARVVIHWRYAPVSAYDNFWRLDPITGWGVWVDEYYYIYPDGMAVRKISWKKGALGQPRQFQESIPLTHPGQIRGDMMEQDWLSIANLNGETQQFEYIPNPPKENDKWIPESPNIQRHNFTSKFDPFIIFEPGNRMNYLKDRDIRNLEKPGSCNHWPVSQAACDGRLAQSSDQPTSFLGFPISDPVVHEESGRMIVHSLYGMTNKSIDFLVSVARSYCRAPKLTSDVSTVESVDYDMGERAFIVHLDADHDGGIALLLHASDHSPVFNPCFVIENWKGPVNPEITIDGQSIPQSKIRSGLRPTVTGQNLIIWIEVETIKQIRITIK